ncbi:hypothetical protein, partial [Mesorhizobium sp. M7A.F.Ca.CA.001.13.1.1]
KRAAWPGGVGSGDQDKMRPLMKAIAIAAATILCLLHPAVAAQPTCDELVQGGNYFQGKAFEDLSVAQIDALLEVAGKCNSETSTIENYDVILGVRVSRLEDARVQASMAEASQAKANASEQELAKLTEQARALPTDPSSRPALNQIRADMIRIRNESVEVWQSKEWNELDNVTNEKLQAIETGQTQQTAPTENGGTADSTAAEPPSLQNFADQSSSEARISEMTCSARGTAVLGVVNMGTEDPESVVQVALTSTGNFVIEGREVKAFDVLRSGDKIAFSMIAVADYLAGTTGASTGLSDDENMQFHAMQKMFIEGALRGRKRFAIYDVANSRLTFADADGKQFKNITQADCWAH